MPARTRSPGTSLNITTSTVSRATIYRILRRHGLVKVEPAKRPQVVLHPLPSRPAQRDLAGRLHPLPPRRPQRRRDPLLARRPLPLRHLGHRPPPRHRPHRRRHVHQRPRRPRHPGLDTDRQRDGVHHPTVRRQGRPQRLRTPPRQPRHHPEELPAEPPDHLRQSRTLPPNPQTLARRPPHPRHHRPTPTALQPLRRRVQPAPPAPLTRQSDPAAAYHARPKATPAGTHQPHHRVRHDRVSHGNVSLRIHGQLHHIGLGRHLHGTPIIMLIDDLDVRVIHATTGEILRQLTIDPNRRYHGTGQPHGGPTTTDPEKRNQPNPECRFGCPGCLATSHERPRQDSNLRTRLRRPMLYPLSYEGGEGEAIEPSDQSAGELSVLWYGARPSGTRRLQRCCRRHLSARTPNRIG